ncbi:MAG: FtsX-like permease family protein [Bacteroidetes bacterium]|nr:FtsX-like permease family protein [Bacteroidota bacterium]
MKLLLKLAWRNIWRNRRRSILTILAVIFASFLSLLQRGLATGTWEVNVRNTVEMVAGYLQVQRTGYQDNPSLTKSLAYPATLRSILQQTDGVSGFAPRIQGDGLVSFRDRSSGVLLMGLDPEAEQRVSRFHRRVIEGRYLSTGAQDEVVVGTTLLTNLGARVGDTIVVLAQGYDGVLGNLKFRVVGSIRMGVQSFDAGTILMTVGAAQELLAMEGRVSVVAISIDDLNELEEVRTRLQGGIDSAPIGQTSVLTWDEVMPDLAQAMAFDRIGDYFFMVVLIVIVTFGILNTVLMSVTERFREFGVSLAVGMRPFQLVVQVLVESFYMIAIGIVTGSSLGYAINAYVKAHPIIFSGDFEDIYAQYGFLPQMVGSTELWVLGQVVAVIAVASLLSLIYPLYRVARLEPLKGIRHT